MYDFVNHSRRSIKSFDIEVTSGLFEIAEGRMPDVLVESPYARSLLV